MSLNGVNSNYQAYETNTVSGSDKKVSTKEISKTTAYSGVAATYEHASQSEGLVAAVNKKASNASIVAQLKADQETRMAQMQSLVTKMFSKQGITIGTADDMWKALAGGNFTADADTIAQAKEDISENGRSSKPIIETSLGILYPNCFSAFIAPKAIISLSAMYALGSFGPAPRYWHISL